MASLIGLDSTSSGFDPGLQNPPITFGVWGDSGNADGVIGSSNTGVGVFGRSIGTAAPAVKGSSENGTGVEATSAGGTALHARNGADGGAAVTEAFLATPSLAADFRGDVATTGAVRVNGREWLAASELREQVERMLSEFASAEELAAHGIDPRLRPEDLSVDDFVRLANAVALRACHLPPPSRSPSATIRASSEGREGLAGFLEKRKPAWTAR